MTCPPSAWRKHLSSQGVDYPSLLSIKEGIICLLSGEECVSPPSCREGRAMVHLVSVWRISNRGTAFTKAGSKVEDASPPLSVSRGGAACSQWTMLALPLLLQGNLVILPFFTWSRASSPCYTKEEWASPLLCIHSLPSRGGRASLHPESRILGSWGLVFSISQCLKRFEF